MIYKLAEVKENRRKEKPLLTFAACILFSVGFILRFVPTFNLTSGLIMILSLPYLIGFIPGRYYFCHKNTDFIVYFQNWTMGFLIIVLLTYFFILLKFPLAIVSSLYLYLGFIAFINVLLNYNSYISKTFDISSYVRKNSVFLILVPISLIPFLFFKLISGYPLIPSSDVLTQNLVSNHLIQRNVLFLNELLYFPSWNIFVSLISVISDIDSIGIFWGGSLLSRSFYVTVTYLLFKALNFKRIDSVIGALIATNVTEFGLVLNLPHFFGAAIVITLFPFGLLLISSEDAEFGLIKKICPLSLMLILIHLQSGIFAVIILIVTGAIKSLAQRSDVSRRRIHKGVLAITSIAVISALIQLIFQGLIPASNILPYAPTQEFLPFLTYKLLWLIQWYTLPILFFFGIGFLFNLRFDSREDDLEVKLPGVMVLFLFLTPLFFIHRIAGFLRIYVSFFCTRFLTKMGFLNSGVKAIRSILFIILILFPSFTYLNSTIGSLGYFSSYGVEEVNVATFLNLNYKGRDNLIISDESTCFILRGLTVFNTIYSRLSSSVVYQQKLNLILTSNDSHLVLNEIEQLGSGTKLIVISGKTCYWLMTRNTTLGYQPFHEFPGFNKFLTDPHIKEVYSYNGEIFVFEIIPF